MKMLRELLRRYGQMGIAGTLHDIVKKSGEEYQVVGLELWDGRRSASEALRKVLGRR